MKNRIFIWVCILVGVLFAGEAGAQDKPQPKQKAKGNLEICITLDDLPVARASSREERLTITEALLGNLREFGVKAGGFVVAENIEGDFDLLEMWLAEGHTLGSHSFSHPDLNVVPVELYLVDIEKGSDAIESTLAQSKQKNRYFRYPYLHRGASYAVKKQVLDFIKEKKWRIAPVSVDTEDYIYNLQFEKLINKGDSIEIIRLGNEYLDHIMEQIETALTLSEDLLGRQVKHILLLHANSLNAYFLGDLLEEIKNRGFTFIALDEALSDPVYRIEENYVGPQGISYLERLAKTNPDLLPARESR